ncbi:MAG: phage major capsid protein [Flavobacteriales bacterium]|nr:phage major capsid protein [Flavobacteriales bacterium]
MDFKKKSVEEISKLSAEEKDQYFAAKEAHDLEVRTKELEGVQEKAVDAAKAAAQKIVDDANEAAKEAAKTAPEAISKTEFEKFKTEQEEIVKNLGKGMSTKETEIATVAKEFGEQYTEKMNASKDKNGLLEGKIEIKAWTSTDTMTVNDVPSGTYPAAGTVGIMTGVMGFFSRLIPTFFRKPRPFSKILNYVTVEPTEGEIQATVISESYVGAAAVTAECALKPIVKVDFDPLTVNYDYVAVFWKTSRLLLRLFAKMGYNMQARFNELLMEALPNAVLAAVRTGGVAYTADPAFKVATPNNFDAIVAVISGLIKNGFVPNAIMISPTAYGLMITSKGTDGHYNLSNGGSIQIVGATVKYGEYDIELVQDPMLAAGELIVGDLTNVHVFVDNNVEYHQGYNDNDDMRRNIVSNVLENLVAIAIPTGAETGIIKDTFANVKTLITAA